MLQIGCQTYTWEMLGDRWSGGPDDLLDAIASAGYSGIEITDTMIGSYVGKPEAFGRALSTRGLELAAFACASDSGYTEPDRLASDLAMIDRTLDFVAAFPGAVLSLGSATVMSPGDREGKFAAAAELYNAAAELGEKAGVPIAVHPSSHHNTLLFSRADYDRLFALTDPIRLGWVPDTGHILRGGMDILDTLTTYRDRIRYLHLKDVDAAGDWRMLGSGICDTRAVVEIVAASPNFNGWLVLEEESDVAAAGPAKAVQTNRETMRALLA
ncbi:sugar phosphate isomerase/epimerase family protein [Kaistia defluvii]|uniref:Inosose dehydratase n=1 Tax=Kaistia defluvii TaxID=410841 RepID=A0ABV2QVH9_9HYPH